MTDANGRSQAFRGLSTWYRPARPHEHPGPADQPGCGPVLQRRPLAGWFAVFAIFASLVAGTAGGADAAWGAWAAGGYWLAVIGIWLSRGRWANRGLILSLLVGLAGGLVAPTIWLATRWPATPDTFVVSSSASLLVHHGTPYLPAGQLVSVLSYNPYFPAMAIFGLPHAAGLPGLLGDTRVWLILATTAALVLAFSAVAPHSVRQCADCRRAMLACTVLAAASPLLAMPLAVGITDPPMVALVGAALACLARALPGDASRGRFQAGWLPGKARDPEVIAALVIGVACAMKATAWPAFVVIIVTVAARQGARAAARFGAVSVVVAALMTVVTAPALLRYPLGTVYQNLVAFPLGLTKYKTPAASPLPGHLLASIGHAGHDAAIGILLAAGLAVVASLVLRPLWTARAATARLAIALTLLFGLAPATRFGYLDYPLALLGWLVLTRNSAAPDGQWPYVGAPADNAGAASRNLERPRTLRHISGRARPLYGGKHDRGHQEPLTGQPPAVKQA